MLVLQWFAVLILSTLPIAGMSPTPLFLRVYFLLSDENCTFEGQIFDLAKSMFRALQYSQMSLTGNGDELPFEVTLKPKEIGGCNVQDQNREVNIYRYLMDIKKRAELSEGFNVFMGPPLTGDCDFVNQWMIIGEPSQKYIQQLYQVSYICPFLGFASVFFRQLEDSGIIATSNPIAAVSVVVPRKTFLTGLMVYLITFGWKRLAIFHEFGGNHNDIPKMFDTISLPLNVHRSHQIFEIVATGSIWCSMNFTELFLPIQDRIDGKSCWFVEFHSGWFQTIGL